MKGKLTQESRDSAIRWLIKHYFHYVDLTSLENQKNTYPDNWNNPRNAPVRATYESLLGEMERLKNLNDQDLLSEFQREYPIRQELEQEMRNYANETEAKQAEIDAQITHSKKLAAGREKGALKDTTKYLLTLLANNPNKLPEELFDIAKREAELGMNNSPFEFDLADDDILLDGDKEIDIKKFKNIIYKAKSRHMR